MDIDAVLDAKAIIGESPTWASHQQALYWIDVKRPALHRFEVRSGKQRSWQMTSDIGAFALMQDGREAVVALREGIFHLDFGSGALSRLATAPFDPRLFRFNEGACDARGRFWIGVMFDPLDPDAPPQAASLHSFTLQDGLRHEPDAAELHNGMAWSPDGATFYLSHSMRREVYAFSFDVGRGTLGHRRAFIRTPEALGIPDGAAIDTDGGYWCALHGGGRLHRYTAAGKLDADIPLPVSQPTMCAFAGDLLDTLYVTSARDKLSAEQLHHEPLAGGLLRLRPGPTGIPRRCTVR